MGQLVLPQPLVLREINISFATLLSYMLFGPKFPFKKLNRHLPFFLSSSNRNHDKAFAVLFKRKEHNRQIFRNKPQVAYQVTLRKGKILSNIVEVQITSVVLHFFYLSSFFLVIGSSPGLVWGAALDWIEYWLF